MSRKPLDDGAKEILLKVKAAILEEPRRLVMGQWGKLVDPELPLRTADVFPGQLQEREAPPCGTIGCIAGWTTVLGLPKERLTYIERHGQKVVDIGRFDTEEEAKFLLRLNRHQADALFLLPQWQRESNTWPPTYAKAYEEAETPEGRAQVAAGYIDFVIEKGLPTDRSNDWWM